MSAKTKKILWVSLALLTATPVFAKQDQTKSIRTAYQARQARLAAQFHAQEAKHVKLQAAKEKSEASEMPVVLQVAAAAIGLVMLASIGDNRLWLPGLLGAKRCRNLGYTPNRKPANPQKPQRPKLPKRRTDRQNATKVVRGDFFDDDDRLILDIDEVLSLQGDPDLGFDPHVGGKLKDDTSFAIRYQEAAAA